MRFRFRRYVGDQKPAGLLQLVIKLGGDFVSQQSPERQVRRHKHHTDDAAEQHHHPEAKRLGFHGSTTPRR